MSNIINSLKSVNNIIKPFNYIFTTLFIVIITIDSLPNFNKVFADFRLKFKENWKKMRSNNQYIGLLLFYIPFMYFYINKDIMNMLLLFMCMLILDL